jgi:hypothetical protein
MKYLLIRLIPPDENEACFGLAMPVDEALKLCDVIEKTMKFHQHPGDIDGYWVTQSYSIRLEEYTVIDDPWYAMSEDEQEEIEEDADFMIVSAVPAIKDEWYLPAGLVYIELPGNDVVLSGKHVDTEWIGYFPSREYLLEHGDENFQEEHVTQ